MIGPELGLTKPGMTIVCGDSHTSTHGAFGALAFGIGTSEVEHVMATQTLPQDKPKTFRITVEGELPFGVTAKDIILDIIGQIGTDGATGYVIEYAGSAIRALSMEGRMTICNMSIEAGARAGMIAPDDTTFAYLKGRRFSPARRSLGRGRRPLVAHSPPTQEPPSTASSPSTPPHSRPPSPGAPRPAWSPPSTPPSPPSPTPRSEADQKSFARAYEYMDLKPGTAHRRHQDRRRLPRLLHQRPHRRPPRRRLRRRRLPRRHHGPRHGRPRLAGRQSARPKKKASTRIFKTAGFDWREPGCCMCLGMNPDILAARRALRLHQQPQLRRPPGPRRPHPPRLARRWPPPPPSPATSPTSATGSSKRLLAI